MNRIFRKFTQHPILAALVGITTVSLTSLGQISAQAGLIFVPLPSEQASIIQQNQLPSPTNPVTMPTPAPTVAPKEVQPVITPSTTNLSKGQEYYTIPNKPDDLEPLPMGERAPVISNQPDIIPFPNQPPDITPKDVTPNLVKTASSVTHQKNTLATNTSDINKTTTKTIDSKTAHAVAKNQIKHKTTKDMIKAEPKKGSEIPSDKTVKLLASPANTQKSTKEKTVPSLKKGTLKFSDFPAKAYTGKRVTPKISTLKNLNGFYVEALHGAKGEKQFIDTLNKTKPNFAGHYVITSFACGLNCNAAVAYDVKTGEFMELGGGFADCPATDFNPRQKASVTHQVNSRLLIVIGSSASGSCVAGYFEEKNGNVSLISQKNLMTYVP